MPEARVPRVSNVCAEATAEESEPNRHATTTNANDLPIPVSLAYAAEHDRLRDRLLERH